MGRITCANVLSDLYAMGVVNIDHLDVVIKISEQMTFEEQKIVTPLLLKGFVNAATEAEVTIRNVTAVWNPWCTIGGIASAVCLSSEYILPFNAVPGDVLLLTKPLGTQIACAAQTENRWPKIELITTKNELEVLLEQASTSMGRLNRIAAKLMHKYEAHACTDVTGFGILGHAQNLAKYQRESVTFRLTKLPIMKNALKIAKALGISKLVSGVSPETSGGLLIALSEENAKLFSLELKNIEKFDSWIIGSVGRGDRTAVLVPEPEIIEVSFNK